MPDTGAGDAEHLLEVPTNIGTGAGIPVVTESEPPAVAPWSDTLGRTASRAAQLLLLSAVLVGVMWLLVRVSLVVIAALAALILASAVYPLVRWLKGKGWSSLLATGAAFIGILALLSGLVTGIVFAVRSEWDTLSASAVEGWQELQGFVMSGPLPVDTAAIDEALQQATALVTSGAFVGSALTGITAATEFVTGVVLMIVILFFFLKDGPKMWNFALRWVRGETRARFAESGDRTIQILGGYVRGTAIIAAVDAVFIGVALALLGVPLALPLAVIVFVGAFLPIVGATIAGLLAALVALVTNGLIVALIVIAVVIVVNQLEGDLLQPVVMGRTLSLHALVVLLALSVGTIIGGIFGAILAVPLTAVGWAVIQVWTNTYQAGEDPVLGEDPLDAKDRVEAKSSMAERWKYQQMRYQERFNRTLYLTRSSTLRKDEHGGKKNNRHRRD
ncbi:AI-2E family transporter [Corynebacterium occultum]|uniref:AI-2E family transporter n=1 Tax=Corynebacterium occultum TaxID=2675219 RepID=UPI001E5F2DF5|nr:AI-2E family transporter [Corynebacterium occultum]